MPSKSDSAEDEHINEIAEELDMDEEEIRDMIKKSDNSIHKNRNKTIIKLEKLLQEMIILMTLSLLVTITYSYLADSSSIPLFIVLLTYYLIILRQIKSKFRD